MNSADSQEEFYENYKNDLTDIFKRAQDFEDDGKDEFTDSLIYQDLMDINSRYADSYYLASGGMKVIEKIYDEHSDRMVARAKLRLDYSKEAVQGFLAEARLTARLEHPNIVPVYDIGIDKEDDGKPFFTMKLIKGITLNDFLDEENTLDEKLEVLVKICNGLSFAHSKGVLHLDLKPDNIQIGEFGEVLICDWGLAKVISDDLVVTEQDFEVTPLPIETRAMDFSTYQNGGKNQFNQTIAGVVKGSPGYMAYEQFIPGKKLDARTDIFALGSILYKILCGKGISQSSDIKGYFSECEKGVFLKPSDLNPGMKVSRGLEAVAMKSLSKSPDERYQTIKDFEKDIQAYIKGYSPSAEESTLVNDLKLFYKRNNLFVHSILLVVLVSVLFAFMSYSTVNEEMFFRRQNVIYYLSAEKEKIELLLAQKKFVELEKKLADFTKALNYDYYLNHSDIAAPLLKKPSVENAQLMQAFALFMFESYGDLYTLKGNYILALENYMKSGNLDKVSDTKDKLNE